MPDYTENLPGITKTTWDLSGYQFGTNVMDEFLPFRIGPHPDRPNMSQARPGDVVWLDYDGWRMHFRVEEVEPGPVLACWPLVMDGEDHALIRERLVDMVAGVRRNLDV
jgi:hypothetical protein